MGNLCLVMKKTIKTKHDIERCWGWGSGKSFVIPKGSTLVIASNLPEGSGYWLKTVPPALKRNRDFLSWKHNYGILIRPDELESA